MNEIIFGKDSTTNIVSVEIDEDQCIIFTEINGKVEKHFRDHNYWFLTFNNLDYNVMKRLSGQQFYKYIYETKSKNDYYKYIRKADQEKVGFYTVWDQKEAHMIKNGITYYKNMKPEDVSILAFDIETTGLKQDEDSMVLLISNTFRRNGVIEKKLFAYDDYPGQKAMLDAWCAWIRAKDPSIVTNHNIFGFDLHYIKHVADMYGCDLKLGRNSESIRFNKNPSEYRKDGSQSYTYYNASIFGREVIDTMFLSFKYDVGRKYESYGLKNIIKQEGLEKPDRQHYDASQIRHNYKNRLEWAKIKNYAKDDADDALALFDLMAPAFFYMAPYIPRSFQKIINSASGAQLNAMMVRSYLQDGHSIPKASQVFKFDGGLSMGVPGIYKNAIKIDILSCYPSSMLQYELYDKNKDPKKHLLILTDYLFETRKIYKEKGKTDDYFKQQDASLKILLNSLYGFLSAQGLNYNSPLIAEQVTQKGREYLTKAIEYFTSKSPVEWRKLSSNSDSEVEIEL